MVFGIPDRLNKFIHDVFWRWKIRIAHTKVNNVFAPRPRCGFQFVDDIEDVGREPFDSWKFVDQASYPEKVLKISHSNGLTARLQSC